MASIGHGILGLAFGRLQARGRGELGRAMALQGVVSLLPDLDALGLRLGIPYGAAFGHRGAMHSIGMAAALAVGAGLLGRLLRLPLRRTALVAFAALLAHDLADAATDGGLGVALLWPLSEERFFLPWRPLPVAPIGLAGLLGPWGRRVMAAELAFFAPLLLWALWPRRQRAPQLAQPPSEG